MSDVLEVYSSLVYGLAKKFYGAEFEDLVQAGFLGLIKARKNFREDAGVKFSTYAYEYVYGEMYEVANGGSTIRVRKDALKLYKDVVKMRELLTQKFNREVSINEVADYLHIDMNYLYNIMSSLAASISIEECEIRTTQSDNIDDMILLKESLENLDEVEKSVMNYRFFGDLSQDETAKIMGISQVSVSRIESRSKKKIKEFIAS